MSGMYHGGLKGAELATATFEKLIGTPGPIIVAVGLSMLSLFILALSLHLM